MYAQVSQKGKSLADFRGARGSSRVLPWRHASIEADREILNMPSSLPRVGVSCWLCVCVVAAEDIV